MGGGFCGAMVAVHLRRDHPEVDAEVTVIEERAVLGAGLAYGSTDPSHRVNVAAARLSPFEEDGLAFDRWLRAGHLDADDPDVGGPDIVGSDVGGPTSTLFPRRSTFGRYVAGLVDAASGDCGAIRHLRDRAVAAERAPDGQGFVVRLASGGQAGADILVLATGHPPAVLPRQLAALAAAAPDLVLADPWDEAGLARVAAGGGRILLVGSGLTACDVLASLRARGHRAPVVALSRRGLLPRPRTRAAVGSFGAFDENPATTALGLLRRVRRAVASCADAGRPWEDVIAALREQAPTLWRALPEAEQRRLLRHARAHWDVHRFQCAPQIEALIARERAAGSFRVVAAGLVAAGLLVGEPGGARVRIEARGRGGAPVSIEVDAVVNCTGPGRGQAFSASPLLASLAAAGILRPDALGLGIETDEASRALGVDGSADPALLVAGPPARAAFGELMGLPQVSRQPRAVAAGIAAAVVGRPARRSSDPEARSETQARR